jgi:hypothetical protein
MGEYRERTTGEVKSQGEWRAAFPKMALPRVWGANVCDAMNIDPVLPSPAATTTAYQVSVRDGVEQDAKGNWVEKYVAKDMFSDTTDEDGKKTTKAEHEAAYQATLDAEAAASVRAQRDALLAKSDWVTIRAKELGQDVPIAWYNYRGDLRQIPEQDGFPHNVTFPEEPS